MTNEEFVEQINHTLADIESIEDFRIDDTDDPDVIDIVIRGRLREDLCSNKQQSDPISDYDRAMKGLP